jgi:hypothetical protein
LSLATICRGQAGSIWEKLESQTSSDPKSEPLFVAESKPTEFNETIGTHCEVTLVSATTFYQGFSKHCEHLPPAGVIVWWKPGYDIKLKDIKFTVYKKEQADSHRLTVTGQPLVLSASDDLKYPPPVKILSHDEFMNSKVPEVAGACHDAIINSAKDPTSVQFLGPYTASSGTGFNRNQMFINYEIMGRNTYGAVLRHLMTCIANCNQAKGECPVVFVADN